jgi:hypothetical protein
MALTLLTDAYDSVANIDTYWSNRSNTDWTDLSTSKKESYIRQGTDWIDRNFNFSGIRAASSQRLKWPRTSAEDLDGFVVGETDAPWQVKEATAIVADLFRQGTYDLEGIVTSDQAIVREKVDVIEVEYSNSLRQQGQDVLNHVHQLLAPLTTQYGQLLRA